MSMHIRAMNKKSQHTLKWKFEHRLACLQLSTKTNNRIYGCITPFPDRKQWNSVKFWTLISAVSYNVMNTKGEILVTWMELEITSKKLRPCLAWKMEIIRNDIYLLSYYLANKRSPYVRSQGLEIHVNRRK